MGDTKGPPVSLWTGPEEAGPLRRPKDSRNNTQDPGLEQKLSDKLNNSLTFTEDILSTSTLSVDAKEWFPPSHKAANDSSQLPSSSLQGRLLKIKTLKDNNPTADDQVSFNNENYIVEICNDDLQSLHEIIFRITQDPGEYDSALDVVQKVVEPYLEDVEFLGKLANLIVEQALLIPSFSYSAARLCLFMEEQSGLFKPGLVLLCQKKIDQLPYDQGLTLFLAELYAQQYAEEMYGTLLLKCLKNLVKVENCIQESGDFPNNLKVACQVLKLTGSLLDAHYTKDVDYIFDQLELSKNHLSDSLKSLVQCVVNLRSTNWGKTNANHIENNKITSQLGKDVNYQYNTEGVFYGPDGIELTLEERKWLDDMTDDGSDTDLDLNPEMDEEMQIAYKQFLRQKNSS
ncbi:polyadenylate-binding protein-interacting protein 1 isoform X2 [Agrilus planipennis]|uniref:Polyadenylate-binding protein-interacting protein 1 isoform X2 n=1 Tax=Agrilus planipennis TaxID=224129 RepID=A0A1W4WPY7_AGRPL|nr:polyadenylate-binding protein-interacting protein 1 isoform X2 [Agrilus planipennis]